MANRGILSLAALLLLSYCGGTTTESDGVADENVLVITRSNFTTVVLQGSRPSMVEFYSPMCSHCASMAPVVGDLAARYLNRVIVGKVDTTIETDLADQNLIRAVPTFIFFKNGSEQTRIVGAVPEADLAVVLDLLLSSGS